MPNPIQEIRRRNGPGGFLGDEGYDGECGLPAGEAKGGKPRDYGVNVVNPPDPPAPCKVSK